MQRKLTQKLTGSQAPLSVKPPQRNRHEAKVAERPLNSPVWTNQMSTAVCKRHSNIEKLTMCSLFKTKNARAPVTKSRVLVFFGLSLHVGFQFLAYASGFHFLAHASGFHFFAHASGFQSCVFGNPMREQGRTSLAVPSRLHLDVDFKILAFDLVLRECNG